MSQSLNGAIEGLIAKLYSVELTGLRPGNRLKPPLPSCNVSARSLRFALMLALDTALFVLAWFSAYWLRLDFRLSATYIDQIMMVLPFLVGGKLIVFSFSGLYRGMWRYTSLADLWRLARACTFSMLLAAFFIHFGSPLKGVPRSVVLLDAALTFLMAGGLRVGIRTWFDWKNQGGGGRLLLPACLHQRRKTARRILIIGAGGAGEKLLREIFDNPDIHYDVVGFLDDDPGKWNRSLHGVPIFGPASGLTELLRFREVDEIFISMPSATGAQVRRVREVCDQAGVPHKILPAIGQILKNKVSIKALRDVRYEDLLRRPPVRLDSAGIEQVLTGRRVLVTGAGGSIGSELCRQVIRFNPAEMILVDAGESNLYSIHMELKHEHGFHNYHCILSRVQDRPLMEEIFRTHRPDVVFHAAAYKHVPMLERNPWEAVFNNVLGSRVVMEMAHQYGVKRFVLVSTDKAVRPTNVMGTSKRLTELILLSFKGSATRFMAVRFGNVLASSGSVIPLFRRQIEQGGPVTVTHPDVTRYFMTIPEASQLILQAGAMGRGGEIFVLEMGTPVKIADMARDLIRLSGKEPGKDIEIEFTGLRPGEKLYEELITQGENIHRTAHEKIMVLETNGHWNWHGMGAQERYCRWLDQNLEDLYGTAETHDPCAIKQKLHEMVPEYTPQDTECVLQPLGLVEASIETELSRQ